MIKMVVCKGCEERLNNASYALRRHSAALTTAMNTAQANSISEEDFENYRSEMRTTFQEAQAAWDAYCQHMVEHGFSI